MATNKIGEVRVGEAPALMVDGDIIQVSEKVTHYTLAHGMLYFVRVEENGRGADAVKTEELEIVGSWSRFWPGDLPRR